MRPSFKAFLGGLSLLSIQIRAVHGHAVIIAVAGDNGVTGAGFGMVSSVPRDGTDEQPFQIDTSVFKNLIADPCGATLAGGSVNIANSLAAAEKAGNGQLPALTDDMVASITLHQVNGDGGGPFTAMFNADGTGLKWQNATVVTQAPGENGLLVGGPFNSLFEAQLPAGTKCTGGTNGDACLIRVSNGGAAVGAGPFGGCFAVQMPNNGGGNSTTGNGTGGNRSGRNRNNHKLQRSNDISQLKRQIQRLVRRLSISPSEANDLITAAGSALNVPIDLLAGQDDASPNGGNSTTAKNAVISVKQAEQLKVAVKDAVSKAIEMMATGAVTPTSGAVATQVNSNPDLAITRNQEMSASFSSSLATFVSEPVGQPAGTAIITATATGGTGATRTTAAPTATSTSTRGNGNGRNRNNNGNGNGNETETDMAGTETKTRTIAMTLTGMAPTVMQTRTTKSFTLFDIQFKSTNHTTPLIVMDFARRDMLVERRFEVIGAGPRLGKRQDPEPTTTESTPAQTPTSSTPPGTTSILPTSTTPTASTAPIETTTSPTSPTSSDPVSTPVSTPTSTTPVSTPVTSGPSTPIETSQQSTPTSASPTSPTDPAQTSSAASQSSPSATSEISTSAAGTTNAPHRTVLSTSTSVGPTASPSNSGSSNNTGAIVGGVVGGVGGLLLLIALLWFIRRKTHKDKFEENMFAPDRNVDRREMDLAGDDVDDPEAIARPYHLPPSPTRNEMAMSAGSQPLSAQSHGRPLSELDEATSGMSRPTSGTSYYTQPGSGMGMPMPMSMTMPMPMPMSRDHIAYTHSRANSTHDHLTQPSEPATSEGGSSSARLMKDREARRLHVANDNEVIVHTDGGRVDEEPEEDAPREIPPTYESIGGPSGAR
ncbi:hypothetical protein RhiXN_01628 [Rhizoctonia solani]|uniref:Uncharacterized protein n=1 Tax=Rhizoctonia solani TaxID=456999 RepID=A0A8H8P921_9AGAM|nr:uncharacterized protein RhiXN_01628 [Rhizoctonia solani]QRW27033.1 hypothetical protein RhiXN_01628 [Rhizoctonia solani]